VFIFCTCKRISKRANARVHACYIKSAYCSNVVAVSTQNGLEGLVGAHEIVDNWNAPFGHRNELAVDVHVTGHLLLEPLDRMLRCAMVLLQALVVLALHVLHHGAHLALHLALLELHLLHLRPQLTLLFGHTFERIPASTSLTRE